MTVRQLRVYSEYPKNAVELEFIGFSPYQFKGDNKLKTGEGGLATISKYREMEVETLLLGFVTLPPGVSGNDDEDVYGIDLQYVVGRLGIRVEYMRGDTPSTLLSLEPEFTPSFSPGSKSWGAAAFFNYNLTANDDIYWRWDRFNNDPVTGQDIRAFSLGYLRNVGPNSRLGIDYQFKNDVTFNDDQLNNSLSITWNVLY